MTKATIHQPKTLTHDSPVPTITLACWAKNGQQETLARTPSVALNMTFKVLIQVLRMQFGIVLTLSHFQMKTLATQSFLN